MTIAIDINEVIRDYLRAFAKQYSKVVDREVYTLPLLSPVLVLLAPE